MPKYSIKANATAKDVVENNDVVLESGLSLDEAKLASLEYQRQGAHVAVWIEEETKPAPRIVRTVERDHRGNKFTVTRCDGWQI